MTLQPRIVDNGGGTDISVAVDARGPSVGDVGAVALLQSNADELVSATSRGLLADVGSAIQSQKTRSRHADDLRCLFVEDFRSPVLGFFNDAVGSASRDTVIQFAGTPTMRLDPQGQTNAGATSPGRTAATGGVICKRRIHDGFTGPFALEFWFRMTSLNLTSNAFLSASVYNRTGTDAYHGRVWLDPNGNNQPMIAKILDGTATAAANGSPLTGTTAVYTPTVTSLLQNGAGSHLYDPPTGRMDVAGGWHYARLAVDFDTMQYVSIKLDGQPAVDLSAYTLDRTTSAGFAGMHFSFEFSATTATRPRYVNIAAVRGYGG